MYVGRRGGDVGGGVRGRGACGGNGSGRGAHGGEGGSAAAGVAGSGGPTKGYQTSVIVRSITITGDFVIILRFSFLVGRDDGGLFRCSARRDLRASHAADGGWFRAARGACKARGRTAQPDH